MDNKPEHEAYAEFAAFFSLALEDTDTHKIIFLHGWAARDVARADAERQRLTRIANEIMATVYRDTSTLAAEVRAAVLTVINRELEQI